jgi:F0F1-type ATP synthase assembly protein I
MHSGTIVFGSELMGQGKNDRDWQQALSAVGLALAIPWLIGLPAYLGWYIDKKYGTWPLWFIILLALGLIGTGLDIYKLMKQFGQLD